MELCCDIFLGAGQPKWKSRAIIDAYRGRPVRLETKGAFIVKLKAPFRLAVFLVGAALAAQGAVVASFFDQITSTDPTMIGRISRNGVASDWSGPKAWPGLTATTTTYYYTEYVYPVITDGNYFQIEIYDPSTAIFASAYQDSFTPAPGPTSTNYLGDAGSSGGFSGLGFFQVYVPTLSSLDLVINNVTALAGGVSAQYGITVEEFSDTMYDDPSPTPEPASIALTLAGLAAFVLARRRRASEQ